MIAGSTVEVSSECPAVAQHQRMDHADGDHILETFEFAHHQRAMRPGTSVGDVEVVAPGLCFEASFTRWACAAVSRYPVAKLGY